MSIITQIFPDGFHFLSILLQRSIVLMLIAPMHTSIAAEVEGVSLEENIADVLNVDIQAQHLENSYEESHVFNTEGSSSSKKVGLGEVLVGFKSYLEQVAKGNYGYARKPGLKKSANDFYLVINSKLKKCIRLGAGTPTLACCLRKAGMLIYDNPWSKRWEKDMKVKRILLMNAYVYMPPSRH